MSRLSRIHRSKISLLLLVYWRPQRISEGKAPLANRWKIPGWLEKEVIERDKDCVYCRKAFGITGRRGSFSSWEHITNDARIITAENIALCCRSCNSSKGAKLLADWLQSAYCQRQGITPLTVAEVVSKALKSIK